MASQALYKIVLAFYLLFQFLSWVSTCVTFGNPLFTIQNLNGSSQNAQCYWDHVMYGGLSYSYYDFTSAIAHFNKESRCDDGGTATLVLNVFVFLVLLPSTVLTVFRIMEKQQMFPFIQSAADCISYELILLSSALCLLFLSIIVEAGTCYSPIQTSEGTQVQAQAYAFEIVAFFFVIFAIGLGVYMRRVELEYQSGMYGEPSSATAAAAAPSQKVYQSYYDRSEYEEAQRQQQPQQQDANTV